MFGSTRELVIVAAVVVLAGAVVGIGGLYVANYWVAQHRAISSVSRGWAGANAASAVYHSVEVSVQ
jgi:hypothetical protein